MFQFYYLKLFSSFTLFELTRRCLLTVEEHPDRVPSSIGLFCTHDTYHVCTQIDAGAAGFGRERATVTTITSVAVVRRAICWLGVVVTLAAGAIK